MSPARKTTTARKRPSAKKVTRKKSTAAPKSIINRKKGTARKGTARKGTARKTSGGGSQKMADRYDSQGKELAALVDKDGLSLADAAKKMKISKGKAVRLYARAQVKPGQRVTGTDAQIGKAIVNMVDKEGLKFMPDVWARTGLRPAKAKALYQAAGGKGTSGSTAKKTTGRRAKTTTAKAGGRRGRKATGTSETTNGRRRGRKKTTAKKTAASPTRARKAGRPKGRRARREEAKRLLHDVIWDNDSKDAAIVKALEGRTIEVSRELDGRPMRPTDHVVKTVVDIKPTQMSRVIQFEDDRLQTRFIEAREITGIK